MKYVHVFLCNFISFYFGSSEYVARLWSERFRLIPVDRKVKKCHFHLREVIINIIHIIRVEKGSRVVYAISINIKHEQSDKEYVFGYNNKWGITVKMTKIRLLNLIDVFLDPVPIIQSFQYKNLCYNLIEKRGPETQYMFITSWNYEVQFVDYIGFTKLDLSHIIERLGKSEERSEIMLHWESLVS